MKKDEAISILATSLRPREPKDRARYDEAVKMAIDALNCSEIPNNSDTISRQAVTKFLNDWLSCLFENCHKQSASDLKMIIKDFKNLPSAQPETNCSEIPNNSDAISRQAAIDALRKMQTYKLFAGDDMLLIDQAEAQTELMMLPSVQPERKTGRWTLRRVTYLWEGVECEKFETRCSSCDCLPISGIKSTYCPNCGADMRGEQE